jgi:hypothetical protein
MAWPTLLDCRLRELRRNHCATAGQAQTRTYQLTFANISGTDIIFEVLNDRGLDLSITDLLKNYIFRTAANRVAEAQAAWAQMTTVISEVASEPELKNFIRHYWTATHGMTRERELYDAIKKSINSKAKAVEFAKSLAKASTFYAGLSNPASD